MFILNFLLYWINYKWVNFLYKMSIIKKVEILEIFIIFLYNDKFEIEFFWQGMLLFNNNNEECELE